MLALAPLALRSVPLVGPRARHPLVALLVIALSVSGCALVERRDRWDTTRRQVIEPLNAMLHRHLPRYVREHDLTALGDLYVTDRVDDLAWEGGTVVAGDFAEQVRRWRTVAAPAAQASTGAPPLPAASAVPSAPVATTVDAHYRRILALFPTIDKAELRILHVYWHAPEPEGLRADAHLLVRGGDGATRRQLSQRLTLWVVQRGVPWKIARQQVIARELIESSDPAFEVATAASGIDDLHDTTGSPPFRIVGGAFNSSGVAVGDVDADGDEDVVLVSASRLRYYRNRGDGTFEDATAAVGLAAPFPGVGTGALLFDYDNDGFPDLYVASIGPSDRLYRNDGGTFRDVTEAAGIRPSRWSSMAIAADYDRDGHLDLYIVRMGDQESTPPNPNYQAENALPDTLYRNNGDGTFTDVTEAAGLGDRGWGLAGAWGDYDGDGWPDLYVGNEFGLNKLFRNQGDGTFREVGRASGTADRGAAMGVAWGDVDGDGDLDLFVSNMFANSSWLLFHPHFPRPVPWYLRVFTERIRQVTAEITRGSSLFLNNGDGTFTDVSDAAGVRDGQWGWGADFLDYDNDGRLDLYATNGFVSGPRLDDV